MMRIARTHVGSRSRTSMFAVVWMCLVDVVGGVSGDYISLRRCSVVHELMEVYEEAGCYVEMKEKDKSFDAVRRPSIYLHVPSHSRSLQKPSSSPRSKVPAAATATTTFASPTCRAHVNPQSPVYPNGTAVYSFGQSQTVHCAEPLAPSVTASAAPLYLGLHALSISPGTAALDAQVSPRKLDE